MRGPRLVSVLAASGALALLGGCLDDELRVGVDPPTTGGEPAPTPGDEPTDDPTPGPPDAGADSGDEADACADGACAAPVGCAAREGAAFCDDFDSPDALTPTKTKWDFIEPTEVPAVTLSSARAVSAPSSLLTRILDGDTPGAKFAKTVTKAGFTEVTWEYDVFFESVGNEDGFFLGDFQFTDAKGADSFGFRLVMFAEAGAIKELKVEHNAGAIDGPYVIEPALAAGTVTLGAWHHFEQKVTFTFAGGAGFEERDVVAYSLRIDGAAEPQFQKEYASTSREQTSFARIAGMPLVFNKERSAGLAIHWDNHVLEMK